MLALGMATALGACADSSVAPSVADVAYIKATSTSNGPSNVVDSLNHSSLTIDVGAKIQLVAYDGSGSVLAAKWSTSNPAVATVTSSGLLTGKSGGSVNVSAQTKRKAVTASVTVVSTAPSQPTVAGVSASPAQAAIAIGEKVQLKATVTDAQGNALTGQTVSWRSLHSSVASVGSTGIVTGLGAGKASIVALINGIADTSFVGVSAPATVTNSFGRAQRPYAADSPWNTPIPAGAAIDLNSKAMIATVLGSSDGTLRSDPSQYAYPVYFADSSTPRLTMVCTGYVSVNQKDGSRVGISSKQLASVPIPANAKPSAGSDAQIIVIDSETGDEYDIWRFSAPDRCENMTKYEGGVYRSAVESSYTSRGAGAPYLAGLIRPWEITQGHIDHALAFGYDLVRSERCVWPANKSDGQADRLDAIPEGARLQLDPSLDVNQIPGLDAVGRTIARALQKYGAYVIDDSGANKLYAEDNLTANWGTQLVVATVSAIPVERLRVLRLPDSYWASSYNPNHGDCVR
jgi:hypothetical protein